MIQRHTNCQNSECVVCFADAAALCGTGGDGVDMATKSIKVKPVKPRRQMPPPTVLFSDRKKDAAKYACRGRMFKER